MVAVRDEYDRTRPSDAGEALRRGAEQIWASIDDNTELLRVMFREPEALEDFDDELWSAVTATAYQRMATRAERRQGCRRRHRSTIPKRPAPCWWPRSPISRSCSC